MTYSGRLACIVWRTSTALGHDWLCGPARLSHEVAYELFRFSWTRGDFVLATWMLCGTVLAQSVIATNGRVALRGYDPVAYFTESRPVQGVPEFHKDWDGVHCMTSLRPRIGMCLVPIRSCYDVFRLLLVLP